MNALTRWNPFKTAAGFDPMTPFDDLFRGLSAPPWRELDMAPGMRIDVGEDDTTFTVKAEIPGVAKDDIEVSAEGNQVSISAEVKRETGKQNDEKDVYSERYYGRVYRSFTLPCELDSSKADARYDNGVLTLKLPKKQNGATRRIVVS